MTSEPLVEQLGHAGRTACPREQNGGGQQSEAPSARHEQRLRGGPSRVLAFVIEPDQQIRGESGELPEHEQHDDVVAENQTQHRAHEGEERDLKPAGVRMRLEIFRRVQHDQRAHRGDQRRKQYAQAIEMERERQIQPGRPRHRGREWAAGADQPECVDEVARECCGNQCKQARAVGAARSQPTGQRQRKER